METPHSSSVVQSCLSLGKPFPVFPVGIGSRCGNLTSISPLSSSHKDGYGYVAQCFWLVEMSRLLGDGQMQYVTPRHSTGLTHSDRPQHIHKTLFTLLRRKNRVSPITFHLEVNSSRPVPLCTCTGL